MTASASFADLKAGLDVRAGGRIVAASADACSTGFDALDRALAGGFTRGTIATLEGAPSSGRTAVLAGLLERATRDGLAAIIDDGSLYPPTLDVAGVRLERLLIAAAQTPAAIARSADILLRARAFGVVAMPAPALRATVWSRLGGLAQKAGTLLLALGPQAGTELGYFASTRVRCAIEGVVWSGSRGVLCELAGYDVRAHVLKHRRGAPGAAAQIRIADESTTLMQRRSGNVAVPARAVV